MIQLVPQERNLEHCWYNGDAVVKNDVEKVSCEQQLDRMSDLLRKLEYSRYAVV